jgi:hypothetical protein
MLLPANSALHFACHGTSEAVDLAAYHQDKEAAWEDEYTWLSVSYRRLIPDLKPIEEILGGYGCVHMLGVPRL